MLAVRPEVSSGTMSGVARGTHSATLAGVTAHSANPSYVRVATASPTEKPGASTGVEEGALLGKDMLGDRKSTKSPSGIYAPQPPPLHTCDSWTYGCHHRHRLETRIKRELGLGLLTAAVVPAQRDQGSVCKCMVGGSAVCPGHLRASKKGVLGCCGTCTEGKHVSGFQLHSLKNTLRLQRGCHCWLGEGSFPLPPLPPPPLPPPSCWSAGRDPSLLLPPPPQPCTCPMCS